MFIGVSLVGCTTEPPIRPHQRRPCCHGRAAFNPSGGHHILATSGAARYPRDRAYARLTRS